VSRHLVGTVYNLLFRPAGDVDRSAQQICIRQNAGAGFYPFLPEANRVEAFAHG